MKFSVLALFAVCCSWSIVSAHAEEGYPSHPVRIIVPFAAGGPTDIVARLIAKGLSENLKQNFYVENLPGAGGNLGTATAAKTAPDGYTLAVVASSFVVNPSLYARIPYDAEKDFAPISMVGDGPNILIANPSVPIKTANDFVELIKAHPDQYTFASAGVGTTTHLSGELMKLSLGLRMTHVPFSGSGPAIQSLIGGHTPIAFTTIPPAMAMITEGKIRPIAVLARSRAAALPDVPTMAEAGFPGQEGNNFQGLLAPMGTPRSIIEKLNEQVAAIVKTPESAKRFEMLGLDVVANKPEEFQAQIRAEIEKWGKVVKAADLKIE